MTDAEKTLADIAHVKWVQMDSQSCLNDIAEWYTKHWDTIHAALKAQEKVVEVTADGFVQIMGIDGATKDDLSTLKALGVWLKVKFPNGLKIIDGGE